MVFNIYDFTGFTQWIHEGLSDSFSPGMTLTIEWALIAGALLTLVALLGLVLIYLERKVSAVIQQRMGPMRVGPWGTVQTVADVLKLLLKEPLMTRNADKFLFNLAPFIVMIASFLALGALPFALGLQIMDINVGVLYITAVSSVGVVGVLLAGWASNNKFSLIGAMRSGAQIISYELSVGLAILTIVVLAGSLQISEIIAGQENGWWLFKGHIPAFIAFIIFLIAGTAELNRGPFDLPEAESELTAGFHTEYSGFKFAFFFLAEFINMFILAGLGAILFLGGWLPLHFGLDNTFNHVMDFIPPIFWYFGKVFGLILIMMWFKWTFPRLRIDQLLTLEWKYLLPINLLNILLMAFIALQGWYF